MSLPRAFVLPLVCALGIACSAPVEEDDAASSQSTDALVEGIGKADSATLARFDSVSFVPSNNLQVGTWAAYVLTKTNPGLKPSEVVFVNHAAAGAVAIHVDVRTGRAKVIAAPSAGRGTAAVESLLDDVSSLGTSSSTSSGGIRTQGVVDGLTKEAVEAILKSASETLGKESGALLQSIKSYTGSGYLALNKFLREGVMPAGWTDDTAKQTTTSLTQALEAIPPVKATSRRWLFGLPTEADKLDRLVDTIGKLKPGSSYRDPGFMSTSVNEAKPSVAGNAVLRLEIHGASGRDLSYISTVTSENEVLFLPNTNFKVVSVRGEFVPTSSPQYNTEAAWSTVVHRLDDLFPGVSDDVVAQNVKQGKIPNVIVELEELP